MFISGSTALQFFDRTFYADSDLDIYVEHRYRKLVAAWLHSTGYDYSPRNKKDDQTLRDALESHWSCDHDHFLSTSTFFEPKNGGYFGRGVANVYNFFKYQPERKIQLITSHHSPLEIVLNFHSSEFPRLVLISF